MLFRSVVKLVNTAEKKKFYQLLPQKSVVDMKYIEGVRFTGGSNPSAPAICPDSSTDRIREYGSCDEGSSPSLGTKRS